MIVLDKLFVGGLRFVLDKVADAVNAELDDESRLKEELLAAQMEVELGEMSEDRFAEIEAEILARLRRIREERGEGGGLALGGPVEGGAVSAEISFDAGDDDALEGRS